MFFGPGLGPLALDAVFGALYDSSTVGAHGHRNLDATFGVLLVCDAVAFGLVILIYRMIANEQLPFVWSEFNCPSINASACVATTCSTLGGRYSCCVLDSST